jgi:hypothetical protein
MSCSAWVGSVTSSQARRRGVGLQVDAVAVVPDHVVRDVRIEREDRAITSLRLVAAPPGQRVPIALRSLEEDVAFIFGRFGGDELVGTRTRGVNEVVGRLRRPQAVEPQLLHAERGEGRVGRGRRVVAAVVEAVVADPAGVGELAPLDLVGEVAVGRDVAHVPGLPVGARRLRRVGHVAAVPAERLAGQRDGAVGGQGVRIEEDARRPVLAVADEQHALVLQTTVVEEEPARPGAERGAQPLVVEQRVIGGFDRRALRNRVEVGPGERALGLDPGRRLR